jgi:anti-anti-sigma regulatory factor
VYAPQVTAFPAPVSLRLIGVLDGDLLEAFRAIESRLVGIGGAAVIVDVRDLEVLGEHGMTLVASAVREARARGRDVRLDAHGLAWRRVAKKNISGQPAVDAELRSAVRRTVIIARSPKRPRG